MELTDLKVTQLIRAYGAITGKPVTPKSFNYKVKVIERLSALMKEQKLSMADVLKAAGIDTILVDRRDIIAISGNNIPKPPRNVLKSKQALLIELLNREQGATMEQMTHATGWLPHTVRGVLSNALRKKRGLDVISSKINSGERVYRIASPSGECNP